MSFFCKTNKNTSLVPHPGNISFWVLLFAFTVIASHFGPYHQQDWSVYEPYFSNTTNGVLTENDLTPFNISILVLLYATALTFMMAPYAVLIILACSIYVHNSRIIRSDIQNILAPPRAFTSVKPHLLFYGMALIPVIASLLFREFPTSIPAELNNDLAKSIGFLLWGIGSVACLHRFITPQKIKQSL